MLLPETRAQIAAWIAQLDRIGAELDELARINAQARARDVAERDLILARLTWLRAERDALQA